MTINLIGFFNSEIGLGHSVRSYAKAFQATNLKLNYVNIHLPGRANITEFSSLCSKYIPRQFNFIVCGVDMLPGVVRFLKENGSGYKNFVTPYWELEKYPQQALDALAFFDEILAPSEFIKNNLQKYFPEKVTLLSHPISTSHDYTPNHIIDNTLKFLTFFDYDSSTARKNPAGAIEAFQLAFPKELQERVKLTIKTRGTHDRGFRQSLLEIQQNDPRIEVLDRFLDELAMFKLMNDTNVFLSLHRSEGLGLGCAEALSLGKLVISTDYSGTQDFINPRTGIPISYARIAVKQDEYPHSNEQYWANPDITQAAHHLREIYQNPVEAFEKGKTGRNWILSQFNPERISATFLEILSKYQINHN